MSNGRFNALVLRRDTPQLRDLIDKSEALYPTLGAKLNLTTGTWRFPSGARVWFTHCEHEQDVRRFDGHEFHLVCFDELTHFTERQYRAIRARIRGTDPTLPRWTRATTNPGGDGHEWVFGRFGAWLDPSRAPRARFGRLRWYTQQGSQEIDVPRGTPDALSRTFIPALLSDNPHVTADYRAALMQLDPVRRAQLLGGDWLVKPAKGLYFKRAWFQVLEAIPSQITGRCRYWDRAASPEGDWTVGVRMARTVDKRFVIEDVVRFRGTPGEVEASIRTTAHLDGLEVAVVFEQDPGQAGKFEVDYYLRELAGLNVRAVAKRVDKITAAAPLSAQVAAGNVSLLSAPWNEAFVQELEAFPEGAHDDQVDAASGAFSWLAQAVQAARPRLVTSKRTTTW